MPDIPVEDLELSVRTTRTLQNHGIKTADEMSLFFKSRSKPEVLSQIAGFGVKSYREVMELIGHWNHVAMVSQPPPPDDTTELLRSIADSMRRQAEATERLAETIANIYQYGTGWGVVDEQAINVNQGPPDHSARADVQGTQRHDRARRRAQQSVGGGS